MISTWSEWISTERWLEFGPSVDMLKYERREFVYFMNLYWHNIGDLNSNLLLSSILEQMCLYCPLAVDCLELISKNWK